MQYRVISADLRKANGGQSSGPLEIDRPWDAYTNDHIGLMGHLGIREFMVLGFRIGGPFIWNLLKRAPGRTVAAVLAQPSPGAPIGRRPPMIDIAKCRVVVDAADAPSVIGALPAHPPFSNPSRQGLAPVERADDNGLGGARWRRLARKMTDARTPSEKLRIGERASRAQRPGEPLPVEVHSGQDPAGRAPHPHLPPRAPAGYCGASSAASCSPPREPVRLIKEIKSLGLAFTANSFHASGRPI